MAAEYKHTQFGGWTSVIFYGTGALVALMFFAMVDQGEKVVANVMLGLYLLLLALFYNFTVDISDGKLKFWFGIGVIKKSYSLTEIKSAEEVVNPSYYLWGVKSIPDGWLYAITPGSAVEIVFKDSTMIRLGTDQPKKLKQAINDGINI